MDVLLMILTVHLEFSTRALCLFVCEFIVLKTFFFWTLNITLTFDDIHVPQWVGTKDKRSHSVNIICWTLYSTQKNHSEKHFWYIECPKNVDLINFVLPTYFNTRNSFASYHLQMRDILRKKQLARSSDSCDYGLNVLLRMALIFFLERKCYFEYFFSILTHSSLRFSMVPNGYNSIQQPLLVPFPLRFECITVVYFCSLLTGTFHGPRHIDLKMCVFFFILVPKNEKSIVFSTH